MINTAPNITLEYTISLHNFDINAPDNFHYIPYDD